MLKHVTLALDNLHPETWTRHEVEDIRPFLVEQFGARFPDNARIFHGDVCQPNDVTPHDEAGIELLGRLPGPFYVVVFPEGPLAFIAVGFLLAAAAYILLPPPIPQPPNALARNQQASSPNNELSARTNTARINGRIPDIYGEVRSTPDLIAAPYKIFENGKEKEYAYMCIGRGPYTLEDIRDGETLITNIPGASVEIYGPYTSPNSNDAPQLRVGTPIGSRVLNTKRNNSVNGQVLRPPRDGELIGNKNIQFAYPNIIRLVPNERFNDFTKLFVSDDSIVITNASVDGSLPWAFQYVQGVSGFGMQTPKTYGTGPNARELGTIYFTTADESLAEWILEHFQVGVDITMTQTSFRGEAQGSTTTTDLSGTYEIDSVQIQQLFIDDLGLIHPGFPLNFVLSTIAVKLVNPASVNADWNDLSALNYGLSNDFDISAAGDGLTVDLAGTYTVLSVTDTVMVLDNPAAVNADWNDLNTVTFSPIMSPTLTVSAGPRWVGPFILDEAELRGAFFNFVAQAGLYKDDGTDQFAVDVDITMEVTPVDSNDNPIGAAQFFSITLPGSTEDKETVARTATTHFAFTGRCAVRAARITPTDDVFVGTVVDEVRWKDVYSIAPVIEEDFGNITTALAVTFSTASALAVKERKLNMIAKRQVPTYVSGAFTETLAFTQDAALILAAVCRDRYIGNRAESQFDMQNFVDTMAEVETYFGTAKCRQFNYTFDKDNLSFEEIVSSIANAVFCTAYRRGSVIKLSFEKETDDSTLLFNHRNKIPGSEVRSITFGGTQENDGLQYTYVDPDDDSINTIFLPESYAAINPKKIESVGVRDHLHAYFHAWRAWNKILYQTTTIQFDACQEADLLVNNDRILVTDGTRSGSQDGEVLAINGTELTLSQIVDVAADPPYTIFLQHKDGTVEAIGCSAGTDANQVVLDAPPAQTLSVDPENSARTGFVLVGATDPRQTAFLVVEKTPSERMVSTVKAINYDARYYANDPDFIDTVIGAGGYGSSGAFAPAPDGDDGYVPPEPPPGPGYPVMTFGNNGGDNNICGYHPDVGAGSISEPLIIDTGAQDWELDSFRALGDGSSLTDFQITIKGGPSNPFATPAETLWTSAQVRDAITGNIVLNIFRSSMLFSSTGGARRTWHFNFSVVSTLNWTTGQEYALSFTL